MSKLQRLAAERARRQNERASLEESLRLSEGRPSSYAESLERLRRPIRPSSSQGSETLLDPAPVDQAPIGPQSNADTPIGSQSNTDNEAEKSPDSTPASDPVPVQPQGMPVPRLEDLRAAPSRFAIALLGLTPDGRRPDPEPSRYPAHIAQFTAYPTDFDMSAFLGPSPDDIALAAKGPRVGLKAASGPAGSAKSTKKIGDGVKAMTISAAPKPKKRNIDVLAEYNQSQSKPSVNFVVIGHVDHGKSTLLGRLLADLKVVDERTIEQYRREADKMGKSSFAWAWVLDQTSEERSRGITMDTAVNRFETDKASFTILDAPGHRDFIPKMIAGASQADFAVLVIDASPNAFESGIKGQTREHALLVRSMGVQRIIVAVNKMDTINWSHERFQEIQQQMLAFLTTAGFRNEAVSFLPCSGLNGDNVAQRGSENKNASWYTGPNLVELLEDSSPMAQALDKPFRMSIGDIFRGGVSYPLSVSGRLDAGTLQVGQKVKAMPSEESATIKAIERDDQSVDWAVAGHMVVLHLADIDPIHLKVGDVLCSLEHPIANVATLTIKALVFDHLTPMSVDVHRGHLHAPGRITKLVGVLNKASGAVVKKKPKIIKPGAVARIVVELDQSVPLEAPARIILRSNGETVAAGLVEEGRARVEVPDS
ncbi:MAG: Hsp70 suppressor, GTPase facilitates ribosomal subunit dissociation [Watsoniomyces obsoletus]|nr:MAG: Hsp70 suppressor, GTPase facilitates ribosomal subunit dissociation [Watsoniomyces obsoletus]